MKIKVFGIEVRTGPKCGTGSAACACHPADRRSGIRPATAHLSQILIGVLLRVVPAVFPISMTPLSLLFVVVPTNAGIGLAR